jgi:exosortase E/protease (VPEID-CTERM system)
LHILSNLGSLPSSPYIEALQPAEFRWTVLARRILILAVVLGSEALVASVLLDGASLARNGLAGPLTRFLAAWGAWIVRGIVGFAALFTTFAYLKHSAALNALSVEVEQSPIRGALILAHFAAISVFGLLSAILYGGVLFSPPQDLIVVAWAIEGLAAVLLIGLALAPATLWAKLVRLTGKLWLYASAASVAACVLGEESRRLWEPAAKLTFRLVRLMLSPVLSDMILQPDRLRLGTQRFTVIISPECSGLEGVGLLLIFGAIWLVLFRDEIRFPQSLVLLPACILVLSSLNALRLAVLILIGNAGAREIALGGFHSQAGWIAFNTVAFGLSIAARRVTWFSLRASSAREPVPETADATSAYLLPFLAILAAGILSRALSGNFEWLYSLRFFAAVAALWTFRKSYSELEWKLRWVAPLMGALAFLVWIAMSPRGSTPMPVPLANASAALRIAWIAFRVLGAVVTVPIAEELAFRGYLLRRLITPHFESVPFRAFSWFSLILSSMIFGILHGGLWIAGIAAGVLYALAVRWSGRLTDAMIAHATTNGILAIYVLVYQKWALW